MTTATERIYRDVIDKTDWERGPWDDEPDKVQWVDEETGLDCLAVRVRSHGGWCGYVGVPPEHPWHGKNYHECLICGGNFCDEHGYNDIPEGRIDVHGGITFSESCNESGPIESSICHIPFDGRPDNVWWFGFDCAHSGDYSPAMVARLRTLGSTSTLHESDIYRRLDYVRRECASLAKQLMEVSQ